MLKIFKNKYFDFFKNTAIWIFFSIAIIRLFELFVFNLEILYIIGLGFFFFFFHVYYLLKTKVFLNYWSFLLYIVSISLGFNIINYRIKLFAQLDYIYFDLIPFILLFFISIFISSILYAISLIIKIYSSKQQKLSPYKTSFSFVDIIITSFSLIAILFTLLFDINYIQYKAPIPFENWKSITLNDFRGLKRPQENLHGEKKFAFVSTSIRTKQNDNTIQIEALFHPSRSYVFNRNLYSKGLLMHEMYHFHITEYYARLMRKEIKDLIINNKPINIDKIKISLIKKKRELQCQYDDETYHSYVIGKQIEWQNRIDSCLNSLDNYSDKIITLKK